MNLKKNRVFSNTDWYNAFTANHTIWHQWADYGDWEWFAD